MDWLYPRDICVAAEKDQYKNSLLVILFLAIVISANADLLLVCKSPGTPATAEVLRSEAEEEGINFSPRGEG